MTLIFDPAARMQRADEKRRALLRFLRDELYTTPAVAACVMQCGERAARQTVASLEKQGLVKRHVVRWLDGVAPVVLVAITPHGQAMAFDPDAGETCGVRTFEPARFSLTYLQHTLDMQRLRIAVQARIARWVPGEMLGVSSKAVKRPDAIVLLHDKTRVAVEIERTLKNARRYERALAGHLQAIKQNKWHRVVYASPDADTAKRVRALLTQVKRVRIAGVDTLVSPDMLNAFAFCTYNDFPQTLLKGDMQ